MPSLDFNSILLVHPLGRRPGQVKDVARLANIMPPLGLCSITAWLRQHGLFAHILDCYARPDADQQMRAFLQNHRPAFVGFSCTTATFLDGVRLAQLAKQTLPDILTVFGGVHVAAQKEKALDFPELDFAVVGEGEETLRELMQHQGRGAADIKGLVWRDPDGQAQFSGPRPPLPDLDALPFPAYDALEGFPAAYTLPLFNYPTTPNTSCTSSRGCPYTCGYCDRSVFGRSFRANSDEYLYQHLAFLKKHHAIRHVNFYDDQFTLDRGRVARLCRRLVDKPLGMSFNCAVRADHVDLDLLRDLKAAGCWMVSLGLESGDLDLLQRQGRSIDVDRTATAVHWAKRAGLRVKGLVMLGLPGETEASIRTTKDYVFGLPLDDFNLTKFTPFPGAPLFATIREHGDFDEDWERMDCMHFLFVPHGLDRERLEDCFLGFYRDHYLRPRAMWDKFSMLWRSPDSWKRFLRDLPSFLRFARSGKRY